MLCAQITFSTVSACKWHYVHYALFPFIQSTLNSRVKKSQIFHVIQGLRLVRWITWGGEFYFGEGEVEEENLGKN